MTRRILLFGATGYTGGLTAQALVRDGRRPVLVGRNAMATAEVARRACPSDPLAHLTVDVTDLDDLYHLVTPDDVVVTTVGPFLDLGSGLAQTCAEAGASYVDSTGESPFIRWVFDGLGPTAQAGGARLMPAFGYDYVPGQLAAATALAEVAADDTQDRARAHRLEVGYFVTGARRGQPFSGGTLASMTRMSSHSSYTYRGGVVPERLGARTSSFEVHGRKRAALSLGAAEQLTMPELAPGLREVDVYLGWFGSMTRAIAATSPLRGLLSALPGASPVTGTLTRRLAGAASRGPSPRAVQRSRSLVVARVLDRHGAVAGKAVFEGPNPYPLTADLLSWAAGQEAEADAAATASGSAGGRTRHGVLGPVQAYGLEALTEGCAGVGLAPSTDTTT